LSICADESEPEPAARPSTIVREQIRRRGYTTFHVKLPGQCCRRTSDAFVGKLSAREDPRDHTNVSRETTDLVLCCDRGASDEAAGCFT
jgi:hypothetical protein